MLRRLTCLVVATLALSHEAAAQPTLERNVSIPGGAAPLRGTLLIPPGGARVPAALILGGSGPTDRNGNQPTAHTDNLKMLAHALFANGIATLRVDKRGVAASGPAAIAEAELRLDHYVADAKAWLGFLRQQDRVGRVFVIGHSEGALIATLAAPDQQLAGLVLIAGIGSPLGAVLRRQLTAAMPEPMHQKAFNIIAMLERGESMGDIPAELAILLRPSVQPFLISSLKRDPVAALAASTIPALVVQGTTDLQVSLDDARLLAGGRAGVSLAVIDGMNHTLKVAPAEQAAQMRAYSDPDLPLAAELAPAVTNFIRRHAE